jgi:hypothetical protein
MTQPSFVPITAADQVRPALALSVPGAWTSDRPGDLQGPSQPTGRGHGTPGPDQGYALHLARRFEDRLHLGPDEEVEDVLLGSALVASRRAGLFGRAPCIYDLDFVMGLFGFTDAAAPADIVAARRGLFRSVAHSYVAQRVLVDAVPTEALRLAAGRTADARALMATAA